MPVSFAWYDEERTILHGHLGGKWTWQEYHHAFESQARALIEAIDHPIVTMYTADLQNYIPPNMISQLLTINRRSSLPQTKVMASFLVGISPFAEAMIHSLGKVNTRIGSRYRFAKTLEEALPLIRQYLQMPD